MSAPLILLVEDDRTLAEALAETLRIGGFDVVCAHDGSAALDLLAHTAVAGVVTDYQMKPMDGFGLLEAIRNRHPHLPVLMITAHGSIEHAVRCMLEGASDYLSKPFAAQTLVDRLQQLVVARTSSASVIAVDPASVALLDLADRVATRDTTVFITGESGTGKEVLARYIHRNSARRSGPFVAINCAAIPENMLEAVLFGHEKGAFTGAHEARPGKFEQAQGGTLLLDEISEMNVDLQAKLLRVLQEREVERIGGRSPVRLDVRVLATTNRDLRRDIEAGLFREDLYYRLSVFPLTVPPLRDRRGDILPLARHLAMVAAGDVRPVPVLTDDARRLLESHDWPGNVRELSNVIQRALILCSGNTIRARDLRFDAPSAASRTPVVAEARTTVQAALGENLQSIEGQLIVDALNRSVSREQAAALLGISPRTLRYKLARLRDQGLVVPKSRAGYGLPA